MAIINTRFYRESNDTLYSDGDIENVIYERVCKNDSALANDPNWAVFYHFSPIRQNILNWYPFKEGCSILEIGAGCGALTGMLAQRARHVTSCELTMKRAKILYQRHKAFDNLEIFVGNFLDVQFNEKFDYIVVNGVLEYARGIMGSECDDPFSAFLSHAQSYLKPDGIILLSIENRLGLKYLAGAPEDHVGKSFVGINGYKNGEHVQTFSKSELEELFSRAGLSVHRWYYPYPDYKFPTEIFTDDSVNSRKPVSQDIPFDMRRADLFDKEAVYETLMKDQTAGKFSNSFLVELCAGKINRESEPTYIKISNNRKKDFAVCTVLYERNKFVEKIALYPEGANHLASMAAHPDVDTQLKPVTYNAGGSQKLIYPLIEDESLRSILARQIQSKAFDSFWDTIRTLYSCLYTGAPVHQKEDPRFASVFGPAQIHRPLHWTENLNIDLNVDNVFCRDDHWLVIDNEWVFPFLIPAEYAMWRVLSQLQLEPPFLGVLSTESINQFLDITKTETDVFRCWEVYFSEGYVGIQDLSPHYQPVIPLDIDDALTQHQRSNHLVSHLFLFQEGKEPEILECVTGNHDGIWSATFQSENIKNAAWIRWDPLEGCACYISDIDAPGFSVKPINADPDEPAYTFASYDPQFAITGDFARCSQLTIQFRCEIRDWTTGYYKLEVQYNREKELHLHEAALKEQALSDLNGSVQRLQEQEASYQQYVHESNRIMDLLQQETARNQEHIDHLQQETAKKQETIGHLQQEVAHMQETVTVLKQNNAQHIQTVATLNGCLQKANDEAVRNEQIIAELNAEAEQLQHQLQALQTACDREAERNRTLLEYLSSHRLKAIVKIIIGREF